MSYATEHEYVHIGESAAIADQERPASVAAFRAGATAK